jgi:hypothetical protein
MTRFRPSRAGLINIWDYTDEEFVFADGRLVLRGHNGSGKTKALEVLFPFVLDGVVDARRLDPFSGENRTMKSNLLYRGQESEYGFVWMEFAAGERTITLIIAMRAHKDRPAVKTSFFVTGKRLGVDFGLLSEDCRPLTEQQLKRVLEPGAWHDSATDYRDAVDTSLFGLGRERYTQLLDLLLALRRPLLAKDLDPGKVSDTLTAGLSPVSEELVQQAARDFENLAAVQRQVDDLAAADGAARAFLRVYADYLEVGIHAHLDSIKARTGQVVRHASAIGEARVEMRRADDAQKSARQAREAAGIERNTLAGRLDGLKKHEAYTAKGDLDGLRAQVTKEAGEIVQARKANTRAAEHLADLQREAGEVGEQLKKARGVAERHASARAEAAGRAGIPGTGGGDRQEAAAMVTARLQDVEDVRLALKGLDDAERRREYAEQAVQNAEEKIEAREQACETAGRRFGADRAEAEKELRAWAVRWSADHAEAVVSPGDAAFLVEILAHIGETGAPGLGEAFGDLAEARRTILAAGVARLDATLAQAGAELERLTTLRHEVTAERDDAPPLAATRHADRATRPGAALWQLVRFADGVSDADAAAVEGALDAAGILTAWIHPDARLTAAAVEQAEADAYLSPAPVASRPVGHALSGVLVPEEQDLVPAEVVSGVLASIGLTDELTVAPATPVISRRGQFSYGVHLGALPKAAPEYIGATYRAARRRARVAEYERQIQALSEKRERARDDRDALQKHLDDIGRAKAGLRPMGVDILKAVAAVTEGSTLLAAARAEHAEVATTLDTATAAVDAERRRLRQTAAERSMPVTRAEAEAVAQAIGDFTTASERLSQQLTGIATAENDLAGRRRTIERLAGEYRTASAVLTEKEEAHLGAAERLAALEDTLSAPLKEILSQMDEVEQALTTVDGLWRAEDERAREEHDALVKATSAYEHGREALLAALDELLGRLASFAPFTHVDLRPVIGITGAPPWPDHARWAGQEHLATEIIERLSGQEAALAVRSVLPEGVVELLDLYDTSTSDRQAGETARKGAQARMSDALKDFNDALGACEDDYRLDWEPGDSVIVVRVHDADGRHPVAEFARRVADRAEEQGVLLEERERTVLEDELLAGLAQQIFDRVFAARNLVRGMDADTRSRPMSTGTVVGIRWVTSDKITDLQREVSELLREEGLGATQLAGLRRALRQMIRDHRAAHPRATYKEVLSAVLDYRAWRSFELRLKVPGEDDVKLSKKRHSQMSGGEKSAAIHLPLFAAANALYSSARDTCPRMIALDEAFAGIDDVYKPDLLGLTVRYDLDVFMTGHDLWVRYETVPAAAHYDMHSDKASHTVSAMLVLWDGRELLDSTAGFSGNEELAKELLGFTPSRRGPIDAGLLEPAEKSEDQDDG